MSFSIDELENACKKYETHFYGGQVCPNVRRMLASMVQGGHALPKRPKRPKHPKIKIKRKLDNPANPASQVPQVRDLPLRKRSRKEVEVSMSVPSPSPSPDLQGGTKDNTPTNTPKKSLTYIDVILQLNSDEFRRKMFLQRRLAQYDMMHAFGFIHKKTDRVTKPWDNSPGSLLVWSWMVRDFATTLIEDRGVEVLLQGGENAVVNVSSIVRYIVQIHDIIADSVILTSMDFPMLRALEWKVFRTWVMANM